MKLRDGKKNDDGDDDDFILISTTSSADNVNNDTNVGSRRHGDDNDRRRRQRLRAKYGYSVSRAKANVRDNNWYTRPSASEEKRSRDRYLKNKGKDFLLKKKIVC